MTQLIAENLGFAYQAKSVLADVNVTLQPGTVHVLVGPSGCGKTTLLWLLAGLLKPSAGRVIRTAGAGQAAPADDHALGMVFQQPGLWEHLDAQSHLHLVLAGRHLTHAQRTARVDEMLSRLRLTALRRRKPAQLSGGQRQRLSLARALVAAPQWLLLDEPLSHLDGQARSELLLLLEEVLAETTAGVLMSTHEPAEAMHLAKEIIVLVDGRVAQSGPAQQVYNAPATLPAAWALGPAFCLSGEAFQGQLRHDDHVLLAGIDRQRQGQTDLILRPEWLQFTPDDAGMATVRTCRWSGRDYVIALALPGGQSAEFYSQAPVSPGQRGTLRLSRPMR